jgi:hypothetical protein
MDRLQAFYKSRKWENLVKQLRIERATADGFIICEHCGKPILKPYDCIAHHKTELSFANVDDVTVSLNPDNIMLVHFKCHNEIHKRFGYNGRRDIKHVYLVYGAPCSGKTTFVKNTAERTDLILDIDRLFSAVRAECCGEWEKPDEIKSNVFAIRDLLMDMIRTRRGSWSNAYVIGGYALQGERERIADFIGADRIVFIDTPKNICMARAAEKGDIWKMYIDRWFDLYTPPTT